MSSNFTTIINLTSTRPLDTSELQDLVHGLGPHVRQATVQHRPFAAVPDGEKIMDRAQDGIPEPAHDEDEISRIELPVPVIPPVQVEVSETP